MPTIKHIVAQDYGIGIETIYEASQIQAKTLDRGLNTPLVKSVTFSDKSGASHEILDGLVYIMNDVGKTIAKYEFEPLPYKSVNNLVNALSSTNQSFTNSTIT